jgi:Domain of unknown function (DUF4340)
MMRRTGLFVLYGVTVAAVVAAVLVSVGGGRAGTNPLVNRPVLTGLAAHLKDVARLTVVHGDDKTTVLRLAGGWVVEQENDYPADRVKMKRTLLALAALRYAEPKTAKPGLYSRLDVEDAGKKGSDSRLVTLSDAKGQLMDELIVGKRRFDIFGGGNDGVYVRKPGRKQSWLARGSLEMPTGTLDWVDRTITMIPLHRIKSARFTAPGGATVSISRAAEADTFTLAGGIPKGKKLKSSDAVNELGRSLDYFSLDDVMPATALPFPAKETSRAVFTTFDGLTVTVSLIEHDKVTKDQDGKTTVTKKYWVKLLAAGTGKAATEADALNRKVAAWAYAVPDFKAADFRTKLSDLLEPAKSS